MCPSKVVHWLMHVRWRFSITIAQPQELFYKTGVLDIGATFEPAMVSVRKYELAHEVLTGAQVNKRFPGA